MVAETKRLIDFDAAMQSIFEHCAPLPIETALLDSLLGRYLAKPVLSRFDLPLFDNSAVDGYAVCTEDLESGTEHRTLRLVGEVRAGEGTRVDLNPGETVRVFTGSSLPSSTAAVAMQETVNRVDDNITFNEPVSKDENIRRIGSELRRGDVLARVGRVNPGTICALASGGIAFADVGGRPKVGVLVTGDELHRGSSDVSPGHVFESNGSAIGAALNSTGSAPHKIVQCRDDFDSATEVLSQLVDECDVVVTTGGVSVGDYDFMRAAFARIGLEQVFWGVAIKPGKPIYFGKAGSKAVFGLPGNPVSALTTFYLFVRPYLERQEGGEGRHEVVTVRCTSELRKNAGRTEFVPCHIDGAQAHPIVERASHKASCLAGANGLLIVDRAAEVVQEGDTLSAIRLRWWPS